VRTTLEFIECNFVRARMTTNGVTVSAPTGKAIVALFQHNTGRSLDPQTHTYAVLLHVTLREDGQYRAVELGEFFKTKPPHYLDASHQTECPRCSRPMATSLAGCQSLRE
jgi:hypothetical protein